MLTIARWLGPQETGTFGVALLTITAIEQFSETGLRSALIQRNGSIGNYVIPTRTIQVLRGLSLGLFVFFAAGPIAHFLGSPEAIVLLQALAIVPVIRGLEPLSFTIQQRELNFGPTVIAQVSSSVLGFALGVAIAMVYPTAWAQVAATILACTTTTVISTMLTERRLLGLTFDFSPLRDLHHYSRWMFANSIATYIFIRGSDWIVAKLFDTATLAIYQLAFLLTTTITAELGGIAGQLFLPIFSGIQDNKPRAADIFVRSFGALAIVTFLIAAITVNCSSPITKLLLGPQWTGLLPLVPALAIWGVLSAFSSAMASVFQGLGQPRQWTATVIWMTIAFSILVYPTAVAFGPKGTSILLVGIGVGAQLVRCTMIARALDVSLAKVTNYLILPALAFGITTVGTRFLLTQYSIFTPLGELAFTMLLSFGLYVGIIAAGGFLMRPSPSQIINPLFQQFRHFARPIFSPRAKPVSSDSNRR